MLKPLTKEELYILRKLEKSSLLDYEKIEKKLQITKQKIQKIQKNLEKEGIILKYKALINWEKIENFEIRAIIQVNVDPIESKGYDKVAEEIAKYEEVINCMLVSGSFDLLIEISGVSLNQVAFFVADKLSTMKNVKHTLTNFLLKRYKKEGIPVVNADKIRRLPVVM